MKPFPLLLLCSLLAGINPPVFAEPADTAVAAAAASAPAPQPLPPRQPSATAAREGAEMPGELRPENPVVPQINIPLGRTPPAAAESAAHAARRRGVAASGGVDDAAARCQAAATRQLRADCLRRLRPPAQAR